MRKDNTEAILYSKHKFLEMIAPTPPTPPRSLWSPENWVKEVRNFPRKLLKHDYQMPNKKRYWNQNMIVQIKTN